MNKPQGYDDVRAAGEFTPVELGGHYAVIKQVSETKSSTGKNMIVVLFDFDANDKQAGYFKKQFDEDTRPERKWPFAGSKYIMVYDYQDPGKTSRNFKTFCTCAQKSNNFEIDWNSGTAWGKQFVGKKIGVVYGEEESEWDGRVRMRRVPKWFCTADKVAEATVPEPKYLKGKTQTAKPGTTITNVDADGFMNIPNGIEDEIPF